MSNSVLKENMVKLPVVVFGRASVKSVITDAIQLRGHIEKQAIDEENAGGAYIRPIVLFQAQPNTNEDSETLLPEHLSKGFALRGQDAQVRFELSSGDIYNVDIETEGEAMPKLKKASREEMEFLREYLNKLPPESKIKTCADIMANEINKNNRYAARDVSAYVERVIVGMTEDEITAMEFNLHIYAHKIQQKIDILENIHQEKNFKAWLDVGKIVCQPSCKLPMKITLSESIDSLPKSLYDAEKNDMNNFERDTLDALISLDNILWWHKIREKKDFKLNGAFNHYPDFMAQSKSGKIILIEVKGDYLANDDSRAKLSLGKKWEARAGDNFRYFMVFKNKELNLDGAYVLDDFTEMMKDI